MLLRSAMLNSSPVALARTSAISSRMRACASGCFAIAWKYHTKVLEEVSWPAERNVLDANYRKSEDSHAHEGTNAV